MITICMQAHDWTSTNCAPSVLECVTTIYDWQPAVSACIHVENNWNNDCHWHWKAALLFVELCLLQLKSLSWCLELCTWLPDQKADQCHLIKITGAHLSHLSQMECKKRPQKSAELHGDVDCFTSQLYVQKCSHCSIVLYCKGTRYNAHCVYIFMRQAETLPFSKRRSSGA